MSEGFLAASRLATAAHFVALILLDDYGVLILTAHNSTTVPPRPHLKPSFSVNPSNCSLSFSSSGLTTRVPRLLRLGVYRAYDIGCVVVRKWLQNASSTLLTTPVPWSRLSTCYPCSLMETMVILHDRLGLYRPTRQSPSDLQCTQQSALDASSYDNAPCRCPSIRTPSRQRICWVADRSTSPRRTVRPIRERY